MTLLCYYMFVPILGFRVFALFYDWGCKTECPFHHGSQSIKANQFISWVTDQFSKNKLQNVWSFHYILCELMQPVIPLFEACFCFLKNPQNKQHPFCSDQGVRHGRLAASVALLGLQKPLLNANCNCLHWVCQYSNQMSELVIDVVHFLMFSIYICIYIYIIFEY